MVQSFGKTDHLKEVIKKDNLDIRNELWTEKAFCSINVFQRQWSNINIFLVNFCIRIWYLGGGEGDFQTFARSTKLRYVGADVGSDN